MPPRDIPRRDNFIQIVRDLRTPPTETDDGWVKIDDPNDEISPPWLNGWSPGDPDLDVAFYLDKNGKVKYRGVITGGTPGTPAFNLPVGYRPEQTEYFNCVDVANKTLQIIQVDPNGNLIVWDMS